MSVRNDRAHTRSQTTTSDAASPSDYEDFLESEDDSGEELNDGANDRERLCQGKNKEVQQVEANPGGHASPSSQFPQPPSSEPDEFAFYRFFMPPIPPCSFLFACDALYEFQPPQAPHCTMLLLVRWIKLGCAPVLPEELDLGPFVLRKVPKERFALALVLAQSVPPPIFDE
ncbi:hypothetical protein CPB85DRAFT_1565931 [Mucidula mucida]|nr:hypothetical protein CPB85DRAFT_1565931 [Mucidula mucida]